MTYSELVNTVAIKLGMQNKSVDLIASALFDEKVLGLCNGENVKIPRFGTLEKRCKKNSPNAGYIKIVQSRLVKRLFNLVKKQAEE